MHIGGCEKSRCQSYTEVAQLFPYSFVKLSYKLSSSRVLELSHELAAAFVCKADAASATYQEP